MKNVSRDPAGHIKLSVSNFKKSSGFYSRLFKKLSFKQVSYGKNTIGWVTKEGFGISITDAKTPKPRYRFSAPGLHHLCFKARSIKEVDSVYESMKNNTYVFDKPQRYPNYTKNYYAVFFSDPDGIKIEVAYY